MNSEESMVLSQAYNEVMRRYDLSVIIGREMINGKIEIKEREKTSFKEMVKSVYRTLLEIRKEIQNETR